MGMAIQILLLILILVGITVGVFLIITLIKLLRLVDRLSDTLLEIEGSLPEILENMKVITDRSKNITIKTEQAVGTLSRNLVILSSVGQAIKIFRSLFISKKKEEKHEYRGKE